jgi:diadenosine tetraphosphate (Ap4A) HIT family hydrolase
MSDPCVFCDIVTGFAPATVVATWPGARAILPLNPAADGHVLVIPHRHVPDFTTDPDLSAQLMLCAATLAKDMGGDMNLITSKGPAASQTVFHAHLHLVPRHAGDQLLLPWSPTTSQFPGPRTGSSAAGSAPPG